MKTLFQHLFKPKWQHRDPQVRKQAVQALPAEESALVAELARSDPSAEVRLVALRRLATLDLYAERARQDADAALREFAVQRLRQLLEGGREDSPALIARLAFVRTCDNDPALLEYLALQAQESELRALAIGKVNRESTLVEAASRDATHANRMLALSRVQQPGALERVAKQMRTQDKQLYRQARDRLDALQAAEAGQARQQAEAQRLCERLEGLGQSGRWEQDSALLRAWHEQWQALHCTDTALAERYYTAYQHYTQAYARYCQQRDAQASALIPLRAAKREAFTQLEAWARTLPTEVDAPEALAAELSARTESWYALAPLPADEESFWQGQFTAWQQPLQAKLTAAQQRHAWRAAYTAWQRETTRLLAASTVLGAAVIQAWEAQGKQLQAHTPSGLEFSGLEEGLTALQTRQQQQAQTRARLLAEIPQQLAHLEQALAEGALKQADKLHELARQTLQQLHLLGVGEAQLQTAHKRLQALEPELRQLDAWRAWATDAVRERLAQEMERLGGSEEHPETLAKRIHDLQTEWKNLPHSQGAQTLWTRFHQAAQQAYAPCQAHFAAQAAARQQRAEAKAALCDRLELLLATTDWITVEWAALLDFGRELRVLWHELGAVERGQQRALHTRFETLMTQLHAPLEAERAHNLQFRRKLIGQAQALLTLDDIRASTAACRRLQQQWRVTVPGKRSEEHKLWEQFRSACDAVFARRNQVIAERQAALDSQRAVREALLAQLEQLATITDPAQRAEAQAQAQTLASQWAELPPLTPVALEHQFHDRYSQAQTAWQQQNARLAQQQRLQTWLQWAALAGLARRLEALLAYDTAPDAAELASWQTAWDAALAALEDMEARQAFQHRVTPTLAALHADTAARQTQRAALAAQLDPGLEQMMRLEIAAGVESPEALRAARMQYQMARLSRNFGHGSEHAEDDPEMLFRSSYLMAIFPPEAADALAARIDAALQGWLAQQPRNTPRRAKASSRRKPDIRSEAP